MDDADYAKINEQRDRDRALARALTRAEQPAQQIDETGQVICLDCGDPISPARLAARPDAARCTDCKTALEKRGRP